MTQILEGHFSDQLKGKYLTYAMSTIMARALPDVRDGLKPVHRRLLYAMHLLRLDPDKGYKKCARVVGDVIGKYHPHGDQSVYDAMVRLAQDFSVRYPLVDGQGNFGSIDGDGAAAMRYTEARLTEVARWMMKDLDSGTVDFHLTYDESEEEPDVMPASFPNLLANGSSGIAVGLSTNIPPHNVSELCTALVALLKTPTMRDETLLNHIQGPDFPTGGVLTETPEAIQAAYANGKGSFRLRARWETEDLSRGQYQIVVTELPYQVNKAKLVEKIADLMHQKKLPWLGDVRDESAEDIRLVLEPKSKNIEASALMEALFKLTELETRFNLNMYVIHNGKPACLPLKEVLQAFLDHRREVLVRKSTWRLGKIADRLHILDAYLIVYLNIDEVIEIIKNNDQPAPIMMAKFGIDEIQANAILDMRLRRLRKLEEMEIRTEYDGLKAEQAELQAILESDEKQTDFLVGEMKDIKKHFGDARRTSIDQAAPAEVVSLEAMVEKEPITALLSQEGWIRAMKGHLAEDDTPKYKEGDEEAFRLLCQTTDTLTVLTDMGKSYTVQASELPPGRGFGEPLKLMIDMAQEEKVMALFLNTAPKYLLASSVGQGFVAESATLISQTKSGKQVMNVGKGDALSFCIPVAGSHTIVGTIGETGKLLVFPLDDVPTLARGKGVRLMQLKNQRLTALTVGDGQNGIGLISDTGKRQQVFAGNDLLPWVGKRAQVGKNLPLGFKGGAAFFTPEEGEAKPQDDNSNRLDELLAEITKPKDTPPDTEEDRQKQMDLLLSEDD